MTDRFLAIVDDEPDLGRLFCEVAEKAAFKPLYFENGSSFLEYFSSNPNLRYLILDLAMPDIDGVEVLRRLAELGADIGIILVSGYNPSVLHSAHRLATESSLNIIDSLSKPILPVELLPILQTLPENILSTNLPHSDKIIQLTRDELAAAIKHDELILHYQPKVKMHNQKLVGLEALVRWQHPVHGLILPSLFIGLAEQENLIGDLTNWVLHNAVKQLPSCQLKGENISISINVSAKTITDLSLPEQLIELIEHHQLKPSCIILEVTESALMQELITSLDILTRLRLKGFSLSIDDFGTGYSSMLQLHRIPFTELKIDQSFVKLMSDDYEARSIVETCIMLAKKLGMSVVAEGIETQEVWDTLNQCGCDIVQGFFVARPMPFEELIQWIDRD